MDYSEFIKKLTTVAEFKPPQELQFNDIIARPVTTDDIDDDLQAVNSSIEVIRKTRGGSWPNGPIDREFDYIDLAWHEREFRDGTSFAYVVYDANGQYVGAFYLYPMGVRTRLAEELLHYDVDVSWWVTTEAYERGYYGKVYTALRQWLAGNFPFKNIYYSNRIIPQA